MILWYIDEAGVTKDERYIVVGGYCIEDKDYEKVRSDFVKFKQLCMPDATRKLDMKSILQGKRWANSLSIDKRKEILVCFYNFFKHVDCRVIISMVDRDASGKIRNKLEFAYQNMFERVVLNSHDLSKDGKKLAILFTDTMMNFGEVSSWFERWFANGTKYVSNDCLIEQIIPLKMSQSELLQMADMVVGTYTYYKKSLAGQKSTLWAKDVLIEGMDVIREKALLVQAERGKKSVSSIKEYSF